MCWVSGVWWIVHCGGVLEHAAPCDVCVMCDGINKNACVKVAAAEAIAHEVIQISALAQQGCRCAPQWQRGILVGCKGLEQSRQQCTADHLKFGSGRVANTHDWALGNP